MEASLGHFHLVCLNVSNFDSMICSAVNREKVSAPPHTLEMQAPGGHQLDESLLGLTHPTPPRVPPRTPSTHTLSSTTLGIFRVW